MFKVWSGQHPLQWMNKLNIVLGCCLAMSASARGASPDQEYLAARDAYVEHFRPMQTLADKQDKRALKDLQSRLRKLLGPARVEGFSGLGSINLQTLQQDAGYGQVDGLRYGAQNQSLFITSTKLLADYLDANPNLADQLTVALRTDELYRNIFSWNVAVFRYADLPISTRGQLAGAFVAVNAQDIGAFAPNGIFVWTVLDKRILFVSAQLDEADYQIPDCVEHAEQLATQMPDEGSGAESEEAKFARTIALQEASFAAYRSCYAKELPKQLFYPQMLKRAQLIADRLAAK